MRSWLLAGLVAFAETFSAAAAIGFLPRWYAPFDRPPLPIAQRRARPMLARRLQPRFELAIRLAFAPFGCPPLRAMTVNGSDCVTLPATSVTVTRTVCGPFASCVVSTTIVWLDLQRAGHDLRVRLLAGRRRGIDEPIAERHPVDEQAHRLDAAATVHSP